MNGLIALWKGDIINKSTTINTITYNYYVPTMANWYICDGSQIDETFTTPNMVGYVPVGISPDDTVNQHKDTSGNISISEDILINNHNHTMSITTSSVVSNIDISNFYIGTNIFAYEDTNGIQTVGVFHEHPIINDTYGTTKMTAVFITDTIGDGSTYRLNYVSQYFMIYYSTISITNFIFKGMIYHWYGNITSSYPYQPIDSSNNILTNWYVCCDLNSNYSQNIPSVDNKIVVISNTGYSSIDSSSTTIREPIDVGTHTHSIVINESEIATFDASNNAYDTNNNIVSENTTIEKIYGNTSTTSVTLIQQHTHHLDYTTYTFDQSLNTPDLSNNIFKYINLYSIIYLPP